MFCIDKTERVCGQFKIRSRTLTTGLQKISPISYAAEIKICRKSLRYFFVNFSIRVNKHSNFNRSFSIMPRAVIEKFSSLAGQNDEI